MEKLGTKGVIYARYSCEKQREESIIGQIRECEEFARSKGIEIVDIYKDEAMSATNANRPSFQRMILAARSRTFDCVIVWKGDRFSRNRADAARYKAELKKWGPFIVGDRGKHSRLSANIGRFNYRRLGGILFCGTCRKGCPWHDRKLSRRQI